MFRREPTAWGKLLSARCSLLHAFGSLLQVSPSREFSYFLPADVPVSGRIARLPPTLKRSPRTSTPSPRKPRAAGCKRWDLCIPSKKALSAPKWRDASLKFLADVGDTVREGQPLILLDERELQFEVERQQGLVRQVRAQLGLGPKDPPPQDSHQLASVQKADADRFDAQRKYERAQAMFKDNLISQQQFDEAASRFQSTQASYDLALQEVERLKALLISGEASEHLAEKKLTDAAIRAPYPGSVKSRAVHPGEYLKVQSPVMVLVRTDRLRARLAVPERWAGWVKRRSTGRPARRSFSGRPVPGQDHPHQPRGLAGLAHL